jgi:hypothetical protein
MSHFESDCNFGGAGFGHERVSLESILLFMQTLRQDTIQIRSQNQTMMDRIVSIENRVMALLPAVGDAPQCGVVWRCPICGDVSQHAQSFKGHIRRLVYPSGRPKCHLNPSDEHHKRIVSRFGDEGDVFHVRQQKFCQAFHGFVRCVISAKYDENESHVLIASWIAAAMSPDTPFPEHNGSSGSSSSSY